jgi:cytidine deaminase
VSSAAAGAAAGAPTPENPEDLKLITLARAALGRTGAAQGAAVRDTEGRAYAAAGVNIEHFKLSAVAVAVAIAVSSGANGLESVALVGDDEPSAADLEIIRDLAVDGTAIWWADPRGTVQSIIELL